MNQFESEPAVQGKEAEPISAQIRPEDWAEAEEWVKSPNGGQRLLDERNEEGLKMMRASLTGFIRQLRGRDKTEHAYNRHRSIEADLAFATDCRNKITDEQIAEAGGTYGGWKRLGLIQARELGKISVEGKEEPSAPTDEMLKSRDRQSFEAGFAAGTDYKELAKDYAHQLVERAVADRIDDDWLFAARDYLKKTSKLSSPQPSVQTQEPTPQK